MPLFVFLKIGQKGLFLIKIEIKIKIEIGQKGPFGFLRKKLILSKVICRV